jgi:hypothetical protein
MLKIRWENEAPWVHNPTMREQLAKFFNLPKLEVSLRMRNIQMSDFDALQGGTSPSYPSEQYANAKMAQMPNMQERIKLAVVQAEDRLKQVKRAQEIFAAHPELEELLNIMQRNHF